MSLDQLIARLEVATSKLEALAGGIGGGSSSGAPAEVGAAVEAYDEIVSGPLRKFVEAANSIGGEIKEQSIIFENAVKAQREFVVIVSKSKKPSDSAVQELLKPTSDYISQAQEFREKHRNNKDAFNHLSAVSEGIPALGWVMVTPKPGPYVVQMKEAAEFYTNRVLKDHKDNENHKSWARTFALILEDIANFVKKFHTTGLAWNPKGGEASAAPSSSSSSSSSAPAPAPAPAPAASSTSAAKPDTNALFSALNKGGDVTSGLKKVDKSQMTHKNPELRAAGVVKAVEKEETPVAAAGPKGQEAAKPPKFALEGNKWAVEYQVGNKNIVIEEVEAKQTVYILKCTNSTVVVKGKINQITLDGCKKTAVVIDNAISGVDLINCNSCQVQITGKAPTLSIDKTDGAQVFLSKDGLATEIFTSKSTELNISIPGATEDADLIEFPIPEQFKTSWNGSKFATSIVEHKG